MIPASQPSDFANCRIHGNYYSGYVRCPTCEALEKVYMSQQSQSSLAERLRAVARTYALPSWRNPTEIYAIAFAIERQEAELESSLKRSQLERDNYVSQLTLSTKWLGEANRELERLRGEREQDTK